jgi:hypothetical protein
VSCEVQNVFYILRHISHFRIQNTDPTFQSVLRIKISIFLFGDFFLANIPLVCSGLHFILGSLHTNNLMHSGLMDVDRT